MRTGYDSTGGQSHNIPADAEVVMGYIDGPYAWTASDWGRFPRAVRITISVAGNPAHVADVEPGAMTIEQAIKGGYNTVYCAQSDWAINFEAYIRAGVTKPLWWIAAYETPPNPTIPAGAIAHQYYDHGGYDSSVVADYWPGVDPAPTPAPTPEENEVIPGFIVNYGGGIWAVHVTPNGCVREAVLDVQFAFALNAQGYKDAAFSAAQMAAFPVVPAP